MYQAKSDDDSMTCKMASDSLSEFLNSDAVNLPTIVSYASASVSAPQIIDDNSVGIITTDSIDNTVGIGITDSIDQTEATTSSSVVSDQTPARTAFYLAVMMATIFVTLTHLF